jgi:mono/diheme cytochrome c family protein
MRGLGPRASGLGLLLAVACAGGQSRAPMSDGEKLYRAKCTACHRVYRPEEQTAEQWGKTVDKMEALKKVTLSREERAQILQYLSGDVRSQTQTPLR